MGGQVDADGLTEDEMSGQADQGQQQGGEQQQGGTGGEQPKGSQQKAAEFRPISSQEEFDERLSERLQRERAKYSDYDQLKEQAGKYQQLEDEKKTELQREQEQRETLARENQELKLGQLRRDIAEDKGVPAKLLSGSTKEEIEASADALLEYANAANGPRAPKPNPNQGRGSDNSPSGDWLRDSLSAR
ncbi:MAG: DUF4355 domain-containing protein [Hyphomicrobiales bacterium]|nr:MAG: DUF4355 domain-containing protein [Hyphomicrobiales bacterium]